MLAMLAESQLPFTDAMADWKNAGVGGVVAFLVIREVLGFASKVVAGRRDCSSRDSDGLRAELLKKVRDLHARVPSPNSPNAKQLAANAEKANERLEQIQRKLDAQGNTLAQMRREIAKRPPEPGE